MTDYDNEPAYPEIPLALLERLETQFPDKSPDIDTPDRIVWFEAGQAKLVRQLRFQFDRQSERSMKRKR